MIIERDRIWCIFPRVKIRRALISLSDKRNLELLAAGLAKYDVEILSTGGTARALLAAGAAVKEVAVHTGAPEILDGRVKTLHPKIHGGLLGRPIPEHEAQMREHGIAPIDLVVVNLYPFRETVQKGAPFGEVVENIDIGGPSMVRSAAKNYERVCVIVDPDEYPKLLAEMDENQGGVSAAFRFAMMRRAFAYTASYDAAIANYFYSLSDASPAHDEVAVCAPFPTVLTLQWERGQKLRYGENPHQQASFFVSTESTSGLTIANAEVLGGKELSYNNLLDLDAALQLCGEFLRPAAVVVKHNNPCGVAESDEGVAQAYQLARKCDEQSAFGGIVAVNRQVDDALGTLLAETFLECVIAPGFSEGARAALAGKKNLRLLVHKSTQTGPTSLALRSVRGGLLVQSQDDGMVAVADTKVESKRVPTEAERRALEFAWRVCKHVKSNAIVLARADEHSAVTVGIGAGQMSRIDSVRIAVDKAASPVAGTVLASDAFFPFRDGIDAAAKAGIVAVIQPGGSVRDAEVCDAIDEHGMAMLLTGMRHFRH